MSCCDPWGTEKGVDADTPGCPECGGYVDDDGEALAGCNYSPVDCKTCGAAPCDLSC